PFPTLNIILHVCWPDEFEGTSSRDQKNRMAKGLSEEYGLPQLDNDDATIFQARRHMEEVKGFSENFNMYDDDIRRLWDFSNKPKETTAETDVAEEAFKESHEAEISISSPSINNLADVTHLSESYLRE